jgi:hypothetical protein
MVDYSGAKIQLSKGQIQKLKKAIEDVSETSIKLSNSVVDEILEGNGNSLLYLTKTQINRIEKVGAKGNGMVLKLSRAQIKYLRKKLKEKADGLTEDELRQEGGVNPLFLAAVPTLVNKGLEILGLGQDAVDVPTVSEKDAEKYNSEGGVSLNTDSAPETPQAAGASVGGASDTTETPPGTTAISLDKLLKENGLKVVTAKK